MVYLLKIVIFHGKLLNNQSVSTEDLKVPLKSLKPPLFQKTARTFSQNVNLSDPILSRFDLMCVLRDEADPLQERELMAHPISTPEIGGCLERHPIKHKAFTKETMVLSSNLQDIPRYPKIWDVLGWIGQS